jgi:hypothetical protein
MACSCGQKRQQFEVVAENGKVVFTGSKATAQAVAKRYDNSEVRERGAAQAETATP